MACPPAGRCRQSTALKSYSVNRKLEPSPDHPGMATGVCRDPPLSSLVPALLANSGEHGKRVTVQNFSDGIASFVIEQQEPMDWLAFARAMETLIGLRGADLLRVKGILNVAGCRGPVVVQYVQHLAHPPVELNVWPDANRSSRIVFITRNIAEHEVRSLFAAVQALARPEA